MTGESGFLFFGNGAVRCGTFCVLQKGDAVKIPHVGAEMSGRSALSKSNPLLLRLSIQREYAPTLATFMEVLKFDCNNYRKI